MASLGDIQVDVGSDVSGLVAGMAESRKQLDQTITTIQVQDQSWRSLAASTIDFGAAALPAIASVATAVASLASTIAIASSVNSVIAAIGAPVAAIGAAFVRFGGIASTVVGTLLPQWKLVTTAISASLLVYKVATSEMAAESFRAAAGNANLGESTEKLSDAMGRLGSAASGIFDPWLSGAESLLSSLNPFPFLFGKLTAHAASWIDTATAGIESIIPQVVSFGDILQTAVFVTSSLGTATSEQTVAFYEETAALRAMAAQTERVIALQESQRPLFQELGAMQQRAADNAAIAAEKSRIGSLTTIEAVDNETRALQAKVAASILAGKATPESQKQASDLFGALESQRSGIESGAIKPKETAAATAIAAAEAELLKLTEGQDAAAVAALRAKGATDDEIASFSALQREISDTKTAQDEAKKASDALAKSLADAARKNESGAAKIAALKDEIELLNGSATKAETVMRELSRAGFSDEQAEEIGALTAELDQLKEDAKPDKKEKAEKVDHPKLAAAFEGSKEAAQIMLRGVGGGDKMERLAEAHLQETRKVVAALAKQEKMDTPLAVGIV